MRHFSGVLERIHDALAEQLAACPHILFDGARGPLSGPLHADVVARSLRVFSCLRFTAVLLRNAHNKGLFPSHRLLAALLAARVDAVAEAAQLALCALIDIPTFYMAKIEESDHVGALGDPAVRDRLSAIAESWHGVSNRQPAEASLTFGPRRVLSRRKPVPGTLGEAPSAATAQTPLPPRSSGDAAAPATLTLIEVATRSDESLGTSGCAVRLVFVPASLPAQQSDVASPTDARVAQHAVLVRACSAAATIEPATWLADDRPWACLRVDDVRMIVSRAASLMGDSAALPSPAAADVAEALADAFGVPMDARCTLLTRVRAALDFLPAPPAQGRRRRWRLNLMLLAAAATFRCRHSARSIQSMLVDDDVRFGEDIAALLLRAAAPDAVTDKPRLSGRPPLPELRVEAGGGDRGLLTWSVTVGEAIREERLASAALYELQAPEGRARSALVWMAASAALFDALHPSSLESSAVSVAAALSFAMNASQGEGEDGSFPTDDLLATVAAVAFHCGVSGGAMDQLYAGVPAPTPFSPVYQLLTACSRVANSRLADHFAVFDVAGLAPADALRAPWTTPSAEWYAPVPLAWAATATRFAGSNINSADQVGEFVTLLVDLVVSAHRTRAHVALASAAASALSLAAAPEMRAASLVTATLRGGTFLDRLCHRLAQETDHHVHHGMLLLEIEPGVAESSVSHALCRYPELPPSEAAQVVAQASATAAGAGAAAPVPTAAAAGIDLPFDLGAPALAQEPSQLPRSAPSWAPKFSKPDSARFRRVLTPLPEYIRELMAIVFDIISDAIQPSEGMQMAQMVSAAAAGANMLRPLQPATPPTPAPSPETPRASPLLAPRGPGVRRAMSEEEGLQAPEASVHGGTQARAAALYVPLSRSLALRGFREAPAASTAAASLPPPPPPQDIAQAVGRPLEHPLDDFSEHFASDAPLVWVIKDLLAYPEAFGGSLIHIALALVTEIVHADPSLCATAFDCGITPRLLRLLLQRALPSNAQMVTVLPTVISGLILTGTTKERIRQYEIASLVPQEPPPELPAVAPAGSSSGGRPGPMPSPLLTALAVGKSPAMSPINPLAAGGLAAPARRRPSSILSNTLLAMVAASDAAAAPDSGSLPDGIPPAVPVSAGSAEDGNRTPQIVASPDAATAATIQAATAGSVEWAMLYGDRSWSAFNLVHTATAATRHALGPDFNADAWQQLKSHERIVNGAIYALVDFLALMPLPSLSLFAGRPRATSQGGISPAVASLSSFDPRHFFCQGLRLGESGGVPVFLHSNVDLALMCRAPALSVVVDGESVPLPPPAEVVGRPYELWRRRWAVSVVIGSESPIDVYSGSRVVAPEAVTHVHELQPPRSAGIPGDSSHRGLCALQLRRALRSARPHDGGELRAAPQSVGWAVPADAHFVCPAWEDDNTSIISGHSHQFQRSGMSVSQLDRKNIAEVAKRCADFFEPLPGSAEVLAEALRSRLCAVFSYIAALRDAVASRRSELRRDADAGSTTYAAPESGDASSSRKRRRSADAEDSGERGASPPPPAGADREELALEICFDMCLHHATDSLANLLTFARELCRVRENNYGRRLQMTLLQSRLWGTSSFSDFLELAEPVYDMKHCVPTGSFADCPSEDAVAAVQKWVSHWSFAALPDASADSRRLSTRVGAAAVNLLARAGFLTDALHVVDILTQVPVTHYLSQLALSAPVVRWHALDRLFSCARADRLALLSPANVLQTNLRKVDAGLGGLTTHPGGLPLGHEIASHVAQAPLHRLAAIRGTVDDLLLLSLRLDPARAVVWPCSALVAASLALLLSCGGHRLPTSPSVAAARGDFASLSDVFAALWHNPKAMPLPAQSASVSESVAFSVAVSDAASAFSSIGDALPAPHDLPAMRRAAALLSAVEVQLGANMVLHNALLAIETCVNVASQMPRSQLQLSADSPSGGGPSFSANSYALWKWAASWQAAASESLLMPAALLGGSSVLELCAQLSAAQLWHLHAAQTAPAAISAALSRACIVNPALTGCVIFANSANIFAGVLRCVSKALVYLPACALEAPSGHADSRVEAAGLPPFIPLTQLSPWAHAAAHGVASAIGIVLSYPSQVAGVGAPPAAAGLEISSAHGARLALHDSGALLSSASAAGQHLAEFQSDHQVLVAASFLGDALRLTAIALTDFDCGREHVVLLGFKAGGTKGARSAIARLKGEAGSRLNSAVLYAALRGGHLDRIADAITLHAALAGLSASSDALAAAALSVAETDARAMRTAVSRGVAAGLRDHATRLVESKSSSDAHAAAAVIVHSLPSRLERATSDATLVSAPALSPTVRGLLRDILYNSSAAVGTLLERVSTPAFVMDAAGTLAMARQSSRAEIAAALTVTGLGEEYAFGSRQPGTDSSASKLRSPDALRGLKAKHWMGLFRPAAFARAACLTVAHRVVIIAAHSSVIHTAPALQKALLGTLDCAAALRRSSSDALNESSLLDAIAVSALGLSISTQISTQTSGVSSTSAPAAVAANINLHPSLSAKLTHADGTIPLLPPDVLAAGLVLRPLPMLHIALPMALGAGFGDSYAPTVFPVHAAASARSDYVWCIGCRSVSNLASFSATGSDSASDVQRCPRCRLPAIFALTTINAAQSKASASSRSSNRSRDLSWGDVYLGLGPRADADAPDDGAAPAAAPEAAAPAAPVPPPPSAPAGPSRDELVGSIVDMGFDERTAVRALRYVGLVAAPGRALRRVPRAARNLTGAISAIVNGVINTWETDEEEDGGAAAAAPAPVVAAVAAVPAGQVAPTADSRMVDSSGTAATGAPETTSAAHAHRGESAPEPPLVDFATLAALGWAGRSHFASTSVLASAGGSVVPGAVAELLAGRLRADSLCMAVCCEAIPIVALRVSLSLCHPHGARMLVPTQPLNVAAPRFFAATPRRLAAEIAAAQYAVCSIMRRVPAIPRRALPAADSAPPTGPLVWLRAVLASASSVSSATRSWPDLVASMAEPAAASAPAGSHEWFVLSSFCSLARHVPDIRVAITVAVLRTPTSGAPASPAALVAQTFRAVVEVLRSVVQAARSSRSTGIPVGVLDLIRTAAALSRCTPASAVHRVIEGDPTLRLNVDVTSADGASARLRAAPPSMEDALAGLSQRLGGLLVTHEDSVVLLETCVALFPLCGRLLSFEGTCLLEVCREVLLHRAPLSVVRGGSSVVQRIIETLSADAHVHALPPFDPSQRKPARLPLLLRVLSLAIQDAACDIQHFLRRRTEQLAVRFIQRGLSIGAGVKRSMQWSDRHVTGAMPVCLSLHSAVKYVLSSGISSPLDWVAFASLLRVAPRERWLGGLPTVELRPLALERLLETLPLKLSAAAALMFPSTRCAVAGEQYNFAALKDSPGAVACVASDARVEPELPQCRFVGASPLPSSARLAEVIKLHSALSAALTRETELLIDAGEASSSAAVARASKDMGSALDAVAKTAMLPAASGSSHAAVGAVARACAVASEAQRHAVRELLAGLPVAGSPQAALPTAAATLFRALSDALLRPGSSLQVASALVASSVAPGTGAGPNESKSPNVWLAGDAAWPPTAGTLFDAAALESPFLDWLLFAVIPDFVFVSQPQEHSTSSITSHAHEISLFRPEDDIEVLRVAAASTAAASAVAQAQLRPWTLPDGGVVRRALRGLATVANEGIVLLRLVIRSCGPSSVVADVILRRVACAMRTASAPASADGKFDCESRRLAALAAYCTVIFAVADTMADELAAAESASLEKPDLRDGRSPEAVKRDLKLLARRRVNVRLAMHGFSHLLVRAQSSLNMQHSLSARVSSLLVSNLHQLLRPDVQRQVGRAVGELHDASARLSAAYSRFLRATVFLLALRAEAAGLEAVPGVMEALKPLEPGARSVRRAERLVDSVFESLHGRDRAVLQRLSHASLVRWRAEVYSDAVLTRQCTAYFSTKAALYQRSFDARDCRAVAELSRRFIALLQQSQLPFFASSSPSVPAVPLDVAVQAAAAHATDFESPPSWLLHEMECASLVLMRGFYGRPDVTARRHELPAFVRTGPAAAARPSGTRAAGAASSSKKRVRLPSTASKPRAASIDSPGRGGTRSARVDAALHRSGSAAPAEAADVSLAVDVASAPPAEADAGGGTPARVPPPRRRTRSYSGGGISEFDDMPSHRAGSPGFVGGVAVGELGETSPDGTSAQPAGGHVEITIEAGSHADIPSIIAAISQSLDRGGRPSGAVAAAGGEVTAQAPTHVRRRGQSFETAHASSAGSTDAFGAPQSAAHDSAADFDDQFEDEGEGDEDDDEDDGDEGDEDDADEIVLGDDGVVPLLHAGADGDDEDHGEGVEVVLADDEDAEDGERSE